MTETPVARPTRRPPNLGPELLLWQVSIDGDTSDPDGIFWAWVDPGNLWNGFAQPVFERETAREVTAWANKNAQDYDQADYFVWTSPSTLVQVHRTGDDDVDDQYLTTIYHGPTYGIADGWCWQFVGNRPTPLTVKDRIEALATEQGWTDSNLLDLLLSYVSDDPSGIHKLTGNDVVKHLTQIAASENDH